MRNYITSSIANVIRRYRAAAVDMSRMDIGSASDLWHAQLCTVVQQPAGDAHQRRHSGLLTTVGNANGANGLGIVNLLSGSVAQLLKPVNERLFVETTGGSNCQQCPSTGSSGTRVS